MTLGKIDGRFATGDARPISAIQLNNKSGIGVANHENEMLIAPQGRQLSTDPIILA